jgi:hypothetical protein
MKYELAFAKRKTFFRRFNLPQALPAFSFDDDRFKRQMVADDRLRGRGLRVGRSLRVGTGIWRVGRPRRHDERVSVCERIAGACCIFKEICLGTSRN